MTKRPLLILGCLLVAACSDDPKSAQEAAIVTTADEGQIKEEAKNLEVAADKAAKLIEAETQAEIDKAKAEAQEQQ